MQTNLTGLKPFPAETFLFPLEKQMEVMDEDAAQELTAADIEQANKAVKEKLAAERKKAEEAPAVPAAKEAE